MNYDEIVKSGQSVSLELKKWVIVDKEDWLGDGLFYDEDKILCKLSLYSYKGECLVNLVCGGKHFWRSMTAHDLTFEEAKAEFDKKYNELYCIIPDYVEPEWFAERGFEWM